MSPLHQSALHDNLGFSIVAVFLIFLNSSRPRKKKSSLPIMYL
jgi:hypothetical protein